MSDSSEFTKEQLFEQFSYKPQNKLLTDTEVATFFGLKAATLRLMRHQGRGPEYIKVPGCGFVRYTEHAILKWLASGVQHSTSNNLPPPLVMLPQPPGAEPRPWDKTQPPKAAE